MGNDEKKIVEKLTKELKQVKGSEELKKCLNGLREIDKNRGMKSKLTNFFSKGAFACCMELINKEFGKSGNEQPKNGTILDVAKNIHDIIKNKGKEKSTLSGAFETALTEAIKIIEQKEQKQKEKILQEYSEKLKKTVSDTKNKIENLNLQNETTQEKVNKQINSIQESQKKIQNALKKINETNDTKATKLETIVAKEIKQLTKNAQKLENTVKESTMSNGEKEEIIKSLEGVTNTKSGGLKNLLKKLFTVEKAGNHYWGTNWFWKIFGK